MPVKATGAVFDGWFDWSLGIHADQTEMVFAIRLLADERLVGSTRFLNISPRDKRLEIGHIWYAPDVWGTAVNPDCKHLLIGHAVEGMGANRVEIKTDANNARSRAAIAKLGAVEEGILRHHMVVREGRLRDTVMFSVLAGEWPGVRDQLDARLAAFEA
jgi:N-acetyltransferase